jgi:hypothetical protein
MENHLNEINDNESIKLENPRFNMSYTDSKGNRVPGVKDIKAIENIPPEMDDMISMGTGSLNGGRPDTEEASKLFDKV